MLSETRNKAMKDVLIFSPFFSVNLLMLQPFSTEPREQISVGKSKKFPILVSQSQKTTNTREYTESCDVDMRP